MRRTKEAVLELPEKVYRTHEVDLERNQREMYDKVREQLYLEITSLNGAEIIDNLENILKRMLRLVEIASSRFHRRGSERCSARLDGNSFSFSATR